MKKLFIIFLILTFSPTLRFLYSQDSGFNLTSNSDSTRYMKLIIRSAPAFTIEVSGHYDFGVYELSANNNGDFSSSQFINGENFGVRHGIGGTAILKYSINEKGYIRLCGILSFNRFSSMPSRAIRAVVIMPLPNTTELGAVATGSMNAQLALMAAGTMINSGRMPAAVTWIGSRKMSGGMSKLRV